LTLVPSLNEEATSLLLLSDETLGIDVFAPDRETLVDELAEQLLFQWDAYGLEDPERLTVGARRLRDALLARMREDGRDRPETTGVIGPGRFEPLKTA
jgi:hypothetical protein